MDFMNGLSFDYLENLWMTFQCVYVKRNWLRKLPVGNFTRASASISR